MDGRRPALEVTELIEELEFGLEGFDIMNGPVASKPVEDHESFKDDAVVAGGDASEQRGKKPSVEV